MELDIDMDKIKEEPEGGVTATFELTKGDKVTTVTVKAPSYLGVVHALQFVSDERQLATYLVGVSDPEGWTDVEEGDDNG